MAKVYKPTSKAEMEAGFGEIVEKVAGEPCLRDIVKLLMHIMSCAESHGTEDPAHNGLNLLHVALENNYYQAFLTDPNQTHPGVP